MTWQGLIAVVWPFAVLGLFVLFANFLVNRDLAAYRRSQAEAAADRSKDAAE